MNFQNKSSKTVLLLHESMQMNQSMKNQHEKMIINK